jgi:protein phosphatase
MRIEHRAETDVGLRRRGNEDSFLADASRSLFVVADGMGGHAAGEVASRLAVDVIAAALAEESAEPDPGVRLASAFALANQKVLDATREQKKFRGMATTVVAALVEGATVHLAHAGDSRAYLWHGQVLSQLTRDHSWVEERVGTGDLTAEEALKHPLRMMVTRAVGGRPELQAEVQQHPLAAGDLLLLCSDGLTGMVPDRVIAAILDEHADDLDTAARRLVDEANTRGGADNITVVLVACREDPA